MVRLILVVLAVLWLPLTALGQPRAAEPRPVLPPIGLPLPPIGLPLAPIGLPPAPTTGLDRGSHETPPVRDPGWRSRRHRHAPATPVLVYVTPPFGYWPFATESLLMTPQIAPPPVAAAAPPPSEPEPPTGVLRLDLTPVPAAQLFVDGYFIGTLEEIGTEMRLRAGPHAIEIRADAFEAVSFETIIAAGRSITWRGALTPATPPAASPAAVPATESIFYLIPGCYMGNVHPRDVELPAGCDVSGMIVRRMR